VGEVLTTAQLASRAAASRMLVLDPTGELRLSAAALDPADERDVVLVVGPEGGIAAEELARLAGAGAAIAVLGETVLRTSTAGPAALAVVSTLLGRW
jgi:16S rRNA (uracil1498-N3)-methyltransferase